MFGWYARGARPVSDCQIVWATTWTTNDETIDGSHRRVPLDLPCISHIVWNPADEFRQDCGKRPGVSEYIDEPHRPDVTAVPWVDDTIGPGDQRYATPRGSTPSASSLPSDCPAQSGGNGSSESLV
jgi:hypothetical protein